MDDASEVIRRLNLHSYPGPENIEIVEHQSSRLLQSSNKARVEGTRCFGADEWLSVTPISFAGPEPNR